MSADQIVFWIFAPLAVLSAIAMLIQRNAVHSALYLVVNFFCIAVFFLLLGSPFLFVVQIVVYAGAIMVLFLFVIMLLGVDRREPLADRLIAQRPVAIAVGVGIALEIFFAVRLAGAVNDIPPPGFAEATGNGSVKDLAEVLFRDYYLPFEVTSILLIVAAIGAMVLTRRRVSNAEARGEAVPSSGPQGEAA